MSPDNEPPARHSDQVVLPEIRDTEGRISGDFASTSRPSDVRKGESQGPSADAIDSTSPPQLLVAQDADYSSKRLFVEETSGTMDTRSNIALPGVDPAIVAEMQSELKELRQLIDGFASALANVQERLGSWEDETQRRLETFARVVPELEDALRETHQQQSAIECMVSQLNSEVERLDSLAAELIRRQLDLARERSGLETKTVLLASREESLSSPVPCIQNSHAAGDNLEHIWQSNLPGELSDSVSTNDGLSRGPEVTACSQAAASPLGEASEVSPSIVNTSNVEQRERPTSQRSYDPQEDWREQAHTGCARMRNEVSLEAEGDPQPAMARSDWPESHNQEKPTDELDQDHEAVIQDYVARLLKKTAPSVSRENVALHESVAAMPRKEGERKTGSADQADGEAVRRRPGASRQRGSVRKRAEAPEKNTNFAAMRELANLSSQAAIDRYAKARLQQVLRGKLLVLLISLVCGLGLVALDLWIGVGHLGRAAIVLDFIVMVVYGIQYGLLTGRLIINPKGQLQLAERRIGREMRKLLPITKPSLVESDAGDAPAEGVLRGATE